MNDNKNPVYSGTNEKKKAKNKPVYSGTNDKKKAKEKNQSTLAQEPISVVTSQLKDEYSEIC